MRITKEWLRIGEWRQSAKAPLFTRHAYIELIVKAASGRFFFAHYYAVIGIGDRTPHPLDGEAQLTENLLRIVNQDLANGYILEGRHGSIVPLEVWSGWNWQLRTFKEPKYDALP